MPVLVGEVEKIVKAGHQDRTVRLMSWKRMDLEFRGSDSLLTDT